MLNLKEGKEMSKFIQKQIDSIAVFLALSLVTLMIYFFVLVDKFSDNDKEER